MTIAAHRRVADTADLQVVLARAVAEETLKANRVLLQAKGPARRVLAEDGATGNSLQVRCVCSAAFGCARSASGCFRPELCLADACLHSYAASQHMRLCHMCITRMAGGLKTAHQFSVMLSV